jgi:hypothetical protein
MESILETTRRGHEEIERLEQAITNELADRAKTVGGPEDFIATPAKASSFHQHRDKILQDHRVKKHLLRIRDRSKTLLELYADEDGCVDT